MIHGFLQSLCHEKNIDRILRPSEVVHVTRYDICSCCYPIPKQWADRRVGPMTFTTVISLGNPGENDTTQGTVYA
jgi:hypothetical protein